LYEELVLDEIENAAGNEGKEYVLDERAKKKL